MPKEPIDQIDREVILKAPVDRVWAALTQADLLSQWFGDTAEVDLRVGGKMRFHWKDFGEGADGVIDVLEPPTRLVFRWRPFEHFRDTPVPVELWLTVEYRLADHPHGTRLTLRETGFAALPDEIRNRARPDNEFGWSEELCDLQKLVHGWNA